MDVQEPQQSGLSAEEQEAVLKQANDLVLSLHKAASECDLPKLTELIDGHPLLLDCRDRQQSMTALHVAIRAGKEASVSLLLNRGASVIVMDKEGLTPLDYARVFHKPKMLARLKTCVRTNPPPLKKVGPLIASFFEAPMDPEFMEWALEHYGAPILDVKGRQLRTSLHFAITTGDVDLVRRLIDMGADVFVRDADNRSPLDIAQLSGNRNMVKVVAGTMRTQLLAFLGLAALFLAFRNGGDVQMAWVVLGLVYPGLITAWTLRKGEATVEVYGEWLTYWAFASILLVIEAVVIRIPKWTTFVAIKAGYGEDAWWLTEWSNEGLVKNILDLYNIFKMVGTLYLVYPSSRGSRVVYRRFFVKQNLEQTQEQQDSGKDPVAKKDD